MILAVAFFVVLSVVLALRWFLSDQENSSTSTTTQNIFGSDDNVSDDGGNNLMNGEGGDGEGGDGEGGDGEGDGEGGDGEGGDGEGGDGEGGDGEGGDGEGDDGESIEEKVCPAGSVKINDQCYLSCLTEEEEISSEIDQNDPTKCFTYQCETGFDLIDNVCEPIPFETTSIPKSEIQYCPDEGDTYRNGKCYSKCANSGWQLSISGNGSAQCRGPCPPEYPTYMGGISCAKQISYGTYEYMPSTDRSHIYDYIDGIDIKEPVDQSCALQDDDRCYTDCHLVSPLGKTKEDYHFENGICSPKCYGEMSVEEEECMPYKNIFNRPLLA